MARPRSLAARLFRSRRAAADAPGRERAVYVNTPAAAHDHPPQYAPNKIRTAKYTAFSFVPKNLFEQFRRVANVYFLFLLILQFIPAVTTGLPGLSAAALFVIVGLTMAKDGYEDSKRRASDRVANRAPATVLGRGWINANRHPPPPPPGAPETQPRLGDGIGIGSDEWAATEWRHIHVGDIVLLQDGDPVPADLLLLSSSDEAGACFVETKNLDGETNLKTKHAPACTVHLGSPRGLASFQCVVDAEPPNTQLYSFKGALRVLGRHRPGSASAEPTQDALGIDNLLLRGSTLCNTQWAVGLALFTGNDTKIMMNAGEPPSKRSRIERMLNYQVLSQFGLLFVLCLVSAVVGGIYYGRPDSFQALFIIAFETKTSGRSAPLYGFLTFWTSLILYQTVVPISLYVTIELVKSFQAYFISQDVDMYYPPADRRCAPRSWNLSDDLGQVEYIFSDKTGTLTQNVMEFRQCTIRGKVYGEIVAAAAAAAADGGGESSRAAELRAAMDARVKQFYGDAYRQGATTTFLDTALYDDLGADSTQTRAIIEFFTVLAVCHTVIASVPDAARPQHIEYKAQSPDEAALVATARDVGFAFLGRDKDRITCSFLGQEQTFQLLATLEFTSARKRMSVVVRREDGRIMLLCKGADSVIIERIRPNQARLRQATLDDLEMFANHGLRTLCLGYRILEEAEYAAWKVDYDRAASSLGDRDAEVEAVCDRIEQQLQLIGGTAIEDKLQDGVPATIAQLALAGIKLWVLTGDKTETAINIGYSCNLLNSDMQLVVVKADDAESTRAQLERALEEFGDTHGDLSYVGGGGGAMAGVARKSPGSWRRLVGRMRGGQRGSSPAFQHARELAQTKNHRRGIKGVWDDIRTRNVPADRRAGLRVRRDAPLGLVIDGHSLKFALEPEVAPLLLELAVRCQSVLCCRVSPLQKALVVRLVKEGLGTLCLAVGDGANDVSMIQEADVGVGISGEEGLQAVMASDYAIAQFRFLQKLLLVHGRWSYLRIASMILNFFYKNVVFTIALLWFQIFCQWSVNNVFDYTVISLYNVLFTSLPPGALGVFDQDLPAVVGAVVPQLYKRGIYKLEYSMARFWMYVVDGMYQSAVVIFVLLYTYYFSSAGAQNGLDSATSDDMGTIGAFCVILTTNLYMTMNNRSWTWVTPAALLLGLALLLGVFFVYGAIYDTAFSSGAAVRIFAQPNFWLLLALTTTGCLLPHYVAKFVRSAWHPTDTDVVREIVHEFRRNRRPSHHQRSDPAMGVLDYATTSPHKEVPFGAIPEQKPLAARLTRRHHAAAGDGHHAMAGAIPLRDFSARPSVVSGSPATGHASPATDAAAATDALNRPGLYQGISYPEKDTALVNYLHMLAHGSAEGPFGGDGGILKRLSTRQRERAAPRRGSSGIGAEVELGEDAATPPLVPDLRRMDSRATVRSSIYFLDDGSLQPHTGYAFAQEERTAPAHRSAWRRRSSRGWPQ